MATEEKVGTVTDYYAKIGVAAINLGEGALQVGDRIRIRGHTTDVIQTVESLEVDHRGVQRAERGSAEALKVGERVRKHADVLRLNGCGRAGGARVLGAGRVRARRLPPPD